MAPLINLEGEPVAQEAVYETSGITFVVIYGILLLLILWRMYKYVQATKVSIRCIRCSTQGDILRDKMLAVHVLLAFFALFDVIYGIGYIHLRRLDYRVYIFHLLALLCFYSAFCLIPLVLNQALEFGGAYYYVRIFSRVAVVLLSLGTVVSIVIECIEQNARSEMKKWNYLFLSLLFSTILISLCIWMLVYAIRIYVFFSRSMQSNVTSQASTERYRAILRILILNIVFSLCALIRGIFSVILVLTYVEYYDGTIHFSSLAWFLLSQWIPFPISSCLMLYVCTPDHRNRAPSRKRSIEKNPVKSRSSQESPFSKRTVSDVENVQSSVLVDGETSNPVFEMTDYERDSSELSFSLE